MGHGDRIAFPTSGRSFTAEELSAEVVDEPLPLLRLARAAMGDGRRDRLLQQRRERDPREVPGPAPIRR